MIKVQKDLEALIEIALEDGAFPGCCYAVVTKNKVYKGSLGLKAIYPLKEKNEVDTIYDMASCTKVICTTTCIMQLFERGYLRLADSVKRFLPEFAYEDISIWNLLTHTSGIPEDPPAALRSDVPAMWNFIYNPPRKFNPGEHIDYSDINYILLGKIVEAITKKPLDVYAKENLFEPLKMVDTGFNPLTSHPELSKKEITKGLLKRIAPTEREALPEGDTFIHGYVHDETARIMGGVAGHAGLFSTVDDVSKFIQMVLNNGEGSKGNILQPKTLDLIFTKQVEEKQGVECHGKARSIGWQVPDPGSSAGELVSEETILHTGFTGTNIFIDRKNEIGFVLLSNRVHPTRKNLKHMHHRACMANFIMAHCDEWK